MAIRHDHQEAIGRYCRRRGNGPLERVSGIITQKVSIQIG